jgi:hypothetical protein
MTIHYNFYATASYFMSHLITISDGALLFLIMNCHLANRLSQYRAFVGLIIFISGFSTRQFNEKIIMFLVPAIVILAPYLWKFRRISIIIRFCYWNHTTRFSAPALDLFPIWRHAWWIWQIICSFFGNVAHPHQPSRPLPWGINRKCGNPNKELNH